MPARPATSAEVCCVCNSGRDTRSAWKRRHRPTHFDVSEVPVPERARRGGRDGFGASAPRRRWDTILPRSTFPPSPRGQRVGRLLHYRRFRPRFRSDGRPCLVPPPPPSPRHTGRTQPVPWSERALLHTQHRGRCRWREQAGAQKEHERRPHTGSLSQDGRRRLVVVVIVAAAAAVVVVMVDVE